MPLPPPETNERGSDTTKSEPRFLIIGRIVKAHGIRGEVAVEVLTDFPERFATMTTVYLGGEGEARPVTLSKHRWHKERVLLTFAGITDRNQAEGLKGLFIQIPLDEAMPLDEDHYYLYQLIGLQVVTRQGQVLGKVVEFIETGANGVYVVQSGRKKILLPAIPEVILDIDLAAGTITVNLIDGLI